MPPGAGVGPGQWGPTIRAARRARDAGGDTIMLAPVVDQKLRTVVNQDRVFHAWHRYTTDRAVQRREQLCVTTNRDEDDDDECPDADSNGNGIDDEDD